LTEESFGRERIEKNQCSTSKITGNKNVGVRKHPPNLGHILDFMIGVQKGVGL
jgi:hypothetical protein